jgi:transcription antitermination factor NusG
LTKKNINAYLPLKKVIRQWSDRKKCVEMPLFPNYVFVKATKTEYSKVLDVHGIVRFVSFEGKPALLSEKEIHVLQTLVSGDWDVNKETYCSVGDRVKVVQGPFIGLEGILLERKGSKRFGIKLKSIEQAFSVEIQSCFIEKIQ